MSARLAASRRSVSRTPRKHLRRADFADLPPLRLEVTVNGASQPVDFVDFITIGTEYARRCVSGEEPCCRFVKQQAKKTLEMLDAAKAGGTEYYFSPAHAVDFMTFYENLPHVDEGFYTQPMQELEPHMIWEFMHVYGFRRRGDGTRLVSRCYLEEPRKNVKSGRAAAVGLFDLLGSGQISPVVVIAASTEGQTDRVFKPMRKWVEGVEAGTTDQAKVINQTAAELKSTFAMTTTARLIRCGTNGGAVEALTSMGEHQDGWNPLCIIMEELHAQKPEMYAVLRSAMRARPSGWMYMISTAGYLANGIGWTVRNEMIQVLEQTRIDVDTFAAIYTLDEGDEALLKDASALDKLSDEVITRLCEKANPMWGVSIMPHLILSYWREALERNDTLVEFLRTTFNLWGRASSASVKPESFASCANPQTSIEEFLDFDLWIGIDLASRNDMAAMGLLFDYAPKVAIFAEYWLPQQSEAWLRPTIGRLYTGWEQLRDNSGGRRLTVTPGSSTDFNMIEARIMQLHHQGFKIKGVLGDDKQADQMISSLVKRGLPAGIFRKNRVTATAPTDDLLARVPGKLLIHDDNPILAWNFANVHIARGTDDSIVPKKIDKDSDLKIDGFDAVMQANAGRMGTVVIGDAEEEAVYKTRGFLNG